MTVTKVGTFVPNDYDRMAEPVLTEFRYFADPREEVDAIFNVYHGRDGTALVGWYLDAVGLVTWHRADSVEEAEAWVYEQLTPWAHLDERGEYVACTDECDHDGSKDAEQAYQTLLFAINADKEAFIDAVLLRYFDRDGYELEGVVVGHATW
jgi:hypothetical protein